MRKLTDEEIEGMWEIIQRYYKNHLESQGVKPVLLRDQRGNYTKDALVLVYLAQGYPNTRWVTKEELTEFVRQYYPKVPDVQQARHLGPQKGYYIISTRRGNNVGTLPQEIEGKSAYKLHSLQVVHPNYLPKRRSKNTRKAFENIKKRYNYRCATCGSEEGKPNLRYPNSTTQLQQGHRNPHKPLKSDNVIPQCQFCNRPDRNNWIYDKRGRVVGVANIKVVQSSIRKGYITPEEARKLLEFLKQHLKDEQ